MSAVDGLVWNEEVAGSIPAIPTNFRMLTAIKNLLLKSEDASCLISHMSPNGEGHG